MHKEPIQRPNRDEMKGAIDDHASDDGFVTGGSPKDQDYYPRYKGAKDPSSLSPKAPNRGADEGLHRDEAKLVASVPRNHDGRTGGKKRPQTHS